MSDKHLAHAGIIILVLTCLVALPTLYLYRTVKASAFPENAIEILAQKTEAQVSQTAAPLEPAVDSPTTAPSSSSSQPSPASTQPDQPAPAAPVLPPSPASDPQAADTSLLAAAAGNLVTLDRIPTSLDEAWYWIENGEHGFVFHIPCPDLSSVQYITWEMAERLAQSEVPGRQHPSIELDSRVIAAIAAEGHLSFTGSGVITKNENDVYIEVLGLLGNGSIQICGEGKPTLYGPGLQDFLNWLTQ